MKCITINKFSELSGYTAKAVRNKIDRAVWKEKIHYHRAPDGRIFIVEKAVDDWIRGVTA